MELKRGVPAATVAAISAEVFYPALLVWLDWPDGPVWMHTGTGQLVWGGQTWSGVGAASAATIPEESAGMASTPATLRLAAPAAEILARLNDPIRNRPGRIYWGAVAGRAGNTLIGEPVELHAGYMDAARCTIQSEGGGLTHYMEVTLASGPGARSVSSLFHTAEDQQRRYPGDTAGRLVINALARTETQRWPEQ